MAYALHVFGAAVWVGGLVTLVPSVFGPPSEQLSKTLVRFSELGIVAVIVIVGSGAPTASSTFRTREAYFIRSTAEQSSSKPILLAVTDAMAAHNRFHLMGALPGSIGALRRNVLIEQVLLAVLVVAAAALGLEPPS